MRLLRGVFGELEEMTPGLEARRRCESSWLLKCRWPSLAKSRACIVKNQVCNENILCRLLEKLLQNLLGHVFDPIEIQ